MKTQLRSAILFASLTASALAAGSSEVKVFAAASLTDAMQAIAATYEAQSGDKIVFNFAGSNVLARQISQGAPADIFLSADETEMDVVVRSGLTAPGSRRDLLSNTLVIIVPSDSALNLQRPDDLARGDVKRIALGDPETVPAGVYAKQYLERKGIWPSVQSKLTPTENVRAALAAVASGNVDAGIVYKTDASISNKIKIAYEIPAAEGPRILYPIALMKKAGASVAARRFVSYLESPQAAAVFARYGFLTAR